MVLCLALIIPGHALAAMIQPTGELPLWYEISTCANASDALTVSGYGGELASTSLPSEAYTRSYWIQHGRLTHSLTLTLKLTMYMSSPSVHADSPTRPLTRTLSLPLTRRAPSPYEFVGNACPVAAVAPGPFEITLEKEDGYRC